MKAYGSLDVVPAYSGEDLDTSKNGSVTVKAVMIQQIEYKGGEFNSISIVTSDNECLRVKDGYLSTVLEAFASIYSYPVELSWEKKGKTKVTVA